MKAFILCAGQGLRLGALTANSPKCLVHYRGRPILDHTLEAMRAVGIHDITLVTGFCREQLEPFGLKTVFNPDFATTNMVHSLFCAEQELAGDLIVSYGDIVYRPEILRALMQSEGDIAITVDTRWYELWAQRMDDPLADAETLRINSSGFVTELGKKPKSLEEVQGQYMGLIRFSGSVLPEVKAFYRSLPPEKTYEGRDRRNMFMTSFLQLIIDQLHPIRAVPIAGGWVEIDSPSDRELTMIGEPV